METDPNIVFGKYGIGTARTLAEYEAYSKLDFKRRAEILPNDEGKFATLLTWEPKNFHQADDLDFVVCAIHNDANDTLWREDFKPDTRPLMWDRSIKPNDELREGYSRLAVVFTAKMDSAPSKFVLWPHSKSKGWLNRIEQPVSIGY
jgi:hypothetical protein